MTASLKRMSSFAISAVLSFGISILFMVSATSKEGGFVLFFFAGFALVMAGLMAAMSLQELCLFIIQETGPSAAKAVIQAPKERP